MYRNGTKKKREMTYSKASVIAAGIIVIDSGAVGRSSLHPGISSGGAMDKDTIGNGQRRSNCDAEAEENGSHVEIGLHDEHVATCSKKRRRIRDDRE